MSMPSVFVKVTVGAAEMPLEVVSTFKGSDLTIGVIDVPKNRFGLEITGVNVRVENALEAAINVAAVRKGNVYVATFPASHFALSGSVNNGVTVTLTGKDENGAERSWVAGKGALLVLESDGSVAPGENYKTLHWFDAPPANPRPGDVAPVLGFAKVWGGSAWVDFAGGGSSSGGFEAVGEIKSVGCTFREGAQNDQAVIHSVKIPRKYFERVAMLSAIKLRGASSDSGTWDRSAKMTIYTSASGVWGSTEYAAVPIGGWASFAAVDPELPFTLESDKVTIVFGKETGSANVRVSLVSVPASEGFEIEFQNGTTSKVFAPLIEIVGRVKRDNAVDESAEKLARLAAVKELATNSTANQILAKVNEIINIVKG